MCCADYQEMVYRLISCLASRKYRGLHLAHSVQVVSSTWPILSWVSIEALPLDRCSIFLWNFWDGTVRSIAHSCWYIGNFMRKRMAFVLTSLCFCWISDLLFSIFPLHDLGSWSHGLDSPLVALFASASTHSFSAIPVCPGIHLSTILALGCLHCTRSTCS